MKIWKRNTENDAVRQYLLGNLSDSAREKIERRVLNESEIDQELQATEDELIDQYLGHRLDAKERDQFETHFLSAQERQRKLRFGRTLRSYIHSLPVVTSHQDVSRSRVGYVSQFKLLAQRPVVIGSILFAVALIVFSGYWLISRSPARVGQTLAITLAPGSSRANGETIKRIAAPASYASVEAQLEMGTNEYTAYEVELSRERSSLNTYRALQAKQKDGRYILSVVIQAEILQPGDYTLKLSGITNSGQTELKGEYLFRVTPAR